MSNIMNSTAALTLRLKELLPNHNFEFIIASSDYMFRKPHKRIFELALKKAELLREDVWFCGDNLICDIRGARKAGMTPIWYPAYIDYKLSDDITMEPCLHINDWMELMQLMERL